MLLCVSTVSVKRNCALKKKNYSYFYLKKLFLPIEILIKLSSSPPWGDLIKVELSDC